MKTVARYIAYIAALLSVAFMIVAFGFMLDAKERDRRFQACASVAENNEQWLRCTEGWR